MPFSDTITKRARKRVVVPAGDNRWVVRGNSSLGDTRNAYPVEFDRSIPPHGKYHCACYDNLYGDVRRAKVCSHVVAVILYRQAIRSVAGDHPLPLDAGRATTAVSPPSSPATAIPDVSSFRNPPLPPFITDIRPHQWQAVVEIVDLFRAGKRVVWLDAPTGCLAGDTIIKVLRAKGTRDSTIKDLVHRFNGGESTLGRSRTRTTSWDLSIPTYVQYSDGANVRQGLLKGAYASGVKPVFELCTPTCTIRATAHHRFLTDAGWLRLSELTTDSKVYVRGPRRNLTHAPKPQYRIVNNLHHHPYAGRKGVRPDKGGFSVPFHRLVAEARLNNVPTIAFILDVRAGKTDYKFLDPKIFAVHHLDEDSFNNEPDNLEVIFHVVHHQRHSDESHVLPNVVLEPVLSITSKGSEETYDLEMADAPHNFIANGFVVHNSGKTLIAELVRRVMEVQATYVCSSKTLQDQILGDYPYASVLKGRSNYPTLTRPYPEFDAGDCNAQPGDETSCSWCPNTHWCAYNKAKDAANASPLAVLNTSYFLSAYNYTQSMRRPELVIADECDVLEQELMGFVEFRLGYSMLKILGATPPKKGVHKKAIVDWLTIQFAAATLLMQAISPRTRDVKELRQRRALERMCQGMKLIVKEIGEDVWVRDNAAGPLVLKPVTVDRYGETALWRHGSKWLCMSASIISPEVLAQSLGLTNMEDWGLVRVPMTFPIENRRIYVAPVASMSNKEKDTARPIMVTAIRSVMDLHPDERILVHTVSYELAGYLYDQLEDTRRVLTYRSAAERDDVVREFRSRSGSVLLASSLDRGIDLKGDDCRVVIVAKIPFPYLGDPQVSARLHTPGGQAWYSVQTIRSLVQMTGRAVRSKEDHATTYILDRQFLSNVWRKQGHLLPKWWKEAVDMTFPVRQLTQPQPQQGKGA